MIYHLFALALATASALRMRQPPSLKESFPVNFEERPPIAPFNWQGVAGAPKSWSVVVKREVPHEGSPFTQALEYTTDYNLVETSGSYPAGHVSYLRTVDPATGKTIRKITAGLEGSFVEGLVRMPSTGHWFASTYTERKVVEYDANFNHISTKKYPEMGWGFTRSPDGAHFLATDGSDKVFTINPSTFAVESVKTATCGGRRVSKLNELEMVDDFHGKPTLFGNVYESRVVLALDPTTFVCTHVFKLDGVGFEKVELGEGRGLHVANGIAFNNKTGNFFVTGKNWKSMFEVQLVEDGAGDQNTAALTALGAVLQRAAHIK